MSSGRKSKKQQQQQPKRQETKKPPKKNPLRTDSTLKGSRNGGNRYRATKSKQEKNHDKNTK